jgi:hypothetical protein
VFGGTTSTGAVQSGTVGTAGQVLTSNGAGALPTFQTLASSSAFELIETKTASSSASLEFTTNINSTSYSQILVVMNNIKPSGTSVDFYMEASINGGSTYGATPIYHSMDSVGTDSVGARRAGYGHNYDGGYYKIYLNTIPYLVSGSQSNQTSSTGQFNGTIQFYHLGSTSNYKSLIFNGNNSQTDANQATGNFFGSGHIADSSNDIDGIRFKFSSGNIASGTISLYGLKTA